MKLVIRIATRSTANAVGMRSRPHLAAVPLRLNLVETTETVAQAEATGRDEGSQDGEVTLGIGREAKGRSGAKVSVEAKAKVASETVVAALQPPRALPPFAGGAARMWTVQVTERILARGIYRVIRPRSGWLRVAITLKRMWEARRWECCAPGCARK